MVNRLHRAIRSAAMNRSMLFVYRGLERGVSDTQGETYRCEEGSTWEAQLPRCDSIDFAIPTCIVARRDIEKVISTFFAATQTQNDLCMSIVSKNSLLSLALLMELNIPNRRKRNHTFIR